MTTILVVFAGIFAVFLVYVVFAPTLAHFPHFSRKVPVQCPHQDVPGRVKLKPLRAALFAAYGFSNLRVWRCSLLGRRMKCDEACLHKVEM
jgi:hypothetical protein